MLKKSLKLDEAGNFVIDKDGKHVLVQGKENFAQVIRNILLTIKGSDFLAPWYGNDFLPFVSLSRGGIRAESYLEICIRKALLPENEPRIKEISELYIESIEERTYKVRLTVVDITSNRNSIETRLML